MTRIATITNIALADHAMKQLISRSHSLPGLGVMHGPSGYGKSFAAGHLHTEYNTFYVQCKSVWTRKKFLQAILREMGIVPKNTLGDMMEQACTELMDSERALIIDEADWLADNKNHVMMVMDLFEGSGAPILLVGEERLPAKLSHYEKIHNRILKWVPAQPCQMRDVLLLADIYARGINMDEELLQSMLVATKGVARRITTSLENVRNWAADNGTDRVTITNYTGELFTGQAPRRRS